VLVLFLEEFLLVLLVLFTVVLCLNLTIFLLLKDLLFDKLIFFDGCLEYGTWFSHQNGCGNSSGFGILKLG
jgi:hypothetical protein